MSNGVVRIKRDACTVEVSVSPLINRVWLMVMPVSPHSKKRPISFLRMPAADFPNSQITQKRTRLTPTRKMFSPKGLTKAGEISLTRLKLAAKNRLVPNTAKWAFVFGFTRGQRYSADGGDLRWILGRKVASFEL